MARTMFANHMKNKSFIYWACQTGGWIAYGLSMLLYTFTSDQSFTKIKYERLFTSMVFGFLFTVLLRQLIVKFRLHPPLSKIKWWLLLIVVLVISLFYSLSNSAFVELIHLYVPAQKITFEQRTLYNFISDGPIICAWASFYYLWHYIEINTNTEIDKIRLQGLVKDLELKTIKSHINPHFIFNALNSIRALVDENPESARTAITKLSNILRSSMQAESLEMAPMERELTIVKDYLALEKIRFEDRLNIEYDINSNTLKQFVPPMMLQTLVENALKHGIGKLKNGGTVKITSRFTEAFLELIVENTGSLSDTINNDGFGVASTRNRLNLLYGKEAIFHLKAISDNWVEAKVCIPIVQNIENV